MRIEFWLHMLSAPFTVYRNIHAWKKPGVSQCWRSRKSRRKRWRIALLLGSADSAAAAFSQALLMVSFSSLLMCWIAHMYSRLQVRKELPVNCFYGWALFCTVLASCTGPYAQNGQIFGAHQIFGIRQKFTDFSQTLAVHFSAHRRPIKKCGKHTNDPHHCPRSVFILTASKLEANMEIQRYCLCIIYTWGREGVERGER